LNGAFGIGKTTVARALVPRLGRAVLFDPEIVGMILQRLARVLGYTVEDFQDLPLWRRLTVSGLRLTRLFYPNVVVPMAISNYAYLEEIRTGIRRFDSQFHQFCLIAPAEIVYGRLRQRRSRPADAAWQLRRATECCAVHSDERFGPHVGAGEREVEEIAREILAALNAG
jgi:hypothetical protein